MLAHPTVLEPSVYPNALYGGRTEAMSLYYKTREGEHFQYVDVMSLLAYICKYFKFPVGIKSSMWEIRVKTRKPACVRMAL